MSSETLKLPIIDFSDKELKPGTPLWNSLKIKVRQALEEYGCFEASFDKIAPQLIKSVFDALAELFDLPLQTKMKNTSKMRYRGYTGQHPHVPLFESMTVFDAKSLEKVESFTKMMWPEGNPNFSQILLSYLEQLAELDLMVRKMVLESLGVEQYMDENIESTSYIMRLMKYISPQTSETELGLTSHTDTNFLTILHQNQVNGLEVETSDGEHWIPFKPAADSFLVMTGDSFHAWTNGRLRSPYHRVMITGNETDRYSIGLFTVPKAGYLVKAPEELVDEEHPLLFKPFAHEEFLSYYYTDEARKDKYALKAYCGV